MYRQGIIEESIDNKDILCGLTSYFVSQRIETVLEDEYSVWYINEYPIVKDKITDVVDMLKQHIKEVWDEMIEYGVVHANVEKRYLETIPLHI